MISSDSTTPLTVFAPSATLFHFANAPLLPLVGQKLALANKELATAMMSSCIVAAQLVMLPIALYAGQKADQWGRKPVLHGPFCKISAPIRQRSLAKDYGRSEWQAALSKAKRRKGVPLITIDDF